MKILAIETATVDQSVAILDDDRVLALTEQNEPNSHAKWLVPAIDRALRDCRLSLSDLDGLALSIGPGSFTGLRVGLATLLGFRSVTGLPVAAVPTLEALASNVERGSLPICPILKCRQGELYWAQYEWLDASELKTVLEEQVGPPATVSETLRKPTVVVGPAWDLYRDQIESALDRRRDHLQPAPPERMKPSALSVGFLGLARLKRGELFESGQAPHYVQRAEAELKQGVVPSKSRQIIKGLGKGKRRPTKQVGITAGS
ncbi:MAG TPA: tRNA (adenosine(37)-N6)-threonylcarbamoyltransferase complex dimerization subunit type 1 TsaB [Nitrospiraceae bacterium]|nr:tRNA (adenosine(37)-N6)-threonylcarbamoyltransferase complex dimerization subunit type 1 TsaB [Nitrospiraceae bacterium]